MRIIRYLTGEEMKEAWLWSDRPELDVDGRLKMAEAYLRDRFPDRPSRVLYVACTKNAELRSITMQGILVDPRDEATIQAEWAGVMAL